MAGNNKRRERLFITEAPQRYYLLLQFGIFLATLVFLLYLLMNSMAAIAATSTEIIQRGEFLDSYVDGMVTSLFTKVGILFGVAFILNAILGLFFLQRLTGPLVRIQRLLEEIGSGRIPSSDFYLRKADFPVDLANALSSAIAYLRRQKAGI